MCMFDVLCRLAEDWELKLYPVHVNHKFRPGAAEEDQAFVEEFCRKAGWPCRTFVQDCGALAAAEGLSPEEAGRKVRYEAFSQVAGEISAPPEQIAIAVGQNADDQAETVLFRLLRGTGIDGLSGIAYKRWNEQNMAVIRPLLDVSRSEIEEYCAERNLMPRRDHTNEEPVYMRNRIRLQLLPYLRQEYNPNISTGLNRLAASAAADSDFIWQEAEKAYGQAVVKETGEMVEFSLEILDSLHPAIRIRLYHRALTVIGAAENVAASHLEGIEQVLRSDRPSASWNLPGDAAAEKRYDRLCLRKLTAEAETGELRVSICASTIDDVTAVSRDSAGNHRPTAQFDLGKLQGVYGEEAAKGILLRTRQNGDFIRIQTGTGIHRKKLQDVLVDMKIPKALRDSVKLAAIGSEVLWIIPENGLRGRYSAAYKAEDNCEAPIIILEYSCLI